jgi:hypothetical protein
MRWGFVQSLEAEYFFMNFGRSYHCQITCREVGFSDEIQQQQARLPGGYDLCGECLPWEQLGTWIVFCAYHLVEVPST